MSVIKIKNYSVILDDDFASDIDPELWECRMSSGNPYFRSVDRTDKHNLKRRIAWLHRIAVACPKGKVVDHINGNALDNRRSNLRICSVAENARNRSINKCNTSGFKGVTFAKWMKTRPWHAQIHADKKRLHLGFFGTPEAAALAYNEAAKRHHGEFAKLNKIGGANWQ